MNRITALILSLTLCITLCSCKSKNAKTVDNLISSIGEVTIDSESSIIKAEEAVRALSEEELKQLDNLKALKDARAAYSDLVGRESAIEIVDAIESLGDNINLNSAESVYGVRKLYDQSTASARKYISNYDKLLAAEELLSNLKVENVIHQIDSIGTVTFESTEKISSVVGLYNDLNSIEKKKVTNIETLNSAQTALNNLKKQHQQKELDEKIAAGKKAVNSLRRSVDKVEGITWYFSQNNPRYVDSRSYVLPYIGVSDNQTWLRLRFHYTGDDWIFFDKITVVVDGEKYSKGFDYYEIQRDNDTEVWEYVDIAPSSTDIQMLEAIADSKETIVRFQGDYHFDLTVSKSDKSAIKDVLLAYDVLPID